MAGTTDGTGAATPSLRRNRDAVCLITGNVVNDVGDWMLAVALPVFVYLETRSGVATAALYLIELVVGVTLGPIGGALVDRWNLRATLVATNVLQVVALLPLLAVTSERLWPAFVVAIAQDAIRQVNNPAGFAVLPLVVGDEQLVPANAAASTGGSLARLVGAPLGGIAVATGGLTAVIVADAATFAVGAVTSWMLSRAATTRPNSENGDEPSPSVRAGIRAVRGHRVLPTLLAIQALAHVAYGAFPVLFIAFIADHLDGGGAEVGVIRGSAALGGIVSGLIIARFGTQWSASALMVGGYLLFGIVGLGFVNAPAFTTTLWIYILLFALSGFPNVTSDVGTRATMQQLCPRDVLGRLSGLTSAATAIGFGAGAILAGLLLEVTSARVLFNAQVACYAACGVIGYFGVLRPSRRSG